MQVDVGTPSSRRGTSKKGVSRLRIWDLRIESCRWPIGPTSEPAVFFCGEPTVGGCSWCAEHRRLAFTKSAAELRTRA